MGERGLGTGDRGPAACAGPLAEWGTAYGVPGTAPREASGDRAGTDTHARSLLPQGLPRRRRGEGQGEGRTSTPSPEASGGAAPLRRSLRPRRGAFAGGAVALSPSLWRLVLLVALAALPALAPEAQTRTLEILNADRVEVETDSLTGTVRRMTGNVRVRSDTTSLRARSVVEYVARGESVLTGAVRIVSGRDTLTADRVTYNSASKLAVATGRVRIGTRDGVLTAPEATYNSRDKRATFTGGGRIVQDGAVLEAPSGTYDTQRRFADVAGPLALRDSASTLTAARGTYDARGQRADVVGTVRLVREQDRLDADSLVYFRRTERARAFGRVVLDRRGPGADSLRRSFLFGSALIYDGGRETAEMTAIPEGDEAGGTAPEASGDPASGGRVLVVSLDGAGAGADTTLVRAARVAASRDTLAGTERLVASGGTRLWRDGLGAVADSAIVLRPAAPEGSAPDSPGASGGPAPDRNARAPGDRLDLFGGLAPVVRPTVWASGSQLAADSLWIVSGTLRDSVFARGRAFAGRLDSTLGRVQQLAGARMLGLVREDTLRRLGVGPDAEAVVYEATAEGLLGQVMQIGVDSLTVRFRGGGEIAEIGGTTNAEGTVWAGAIAPADLRLASFAFTPRAQPTREGLLAGWEAAWLAAHPRWDRRASGEAPPGAPEADPPEVAPADARAPGAPPAE